MMATWICPGGLLLFTRVSKDLAFMQTRPPQNNSIMIKFFYAKSGAGSRDDNG